MMGKTHALFDDGKVKVFGELGVFQDEIGGVLEVNLQAEFMGSVGQPAGRFQLHVNNASPIRCWKTDLRVVFKLVLSSRTVVLLIGILITANNRQIQGCPSGETQKTTHTIDIVRIDAITPFGLEALHPFSHELLDSGETLGIANVEPIFIPSIQLVGARGAFFGFGRVGLASTAKACVVEEINVFAVIVSLSACAMRE